MMRSGFSAALLALAFAMGCSGDDDTSAGPAVDPPVESTVTETTVAQPVPAELPGVLEYFETSRDHVEETVDYAIRPPVGGTHAAVWQNCGFYAEPVADEMAVHSLEHGAVWLTFNESIGEQVRQALVDLATVQTHVLVSPYDHDAELVMTAWNRQQVLDVVDADAVVAFVELYQQGPQTPEPGAPCDGGEGEPIS